MIFPLAGLAIGAILGVLMARRAGGKAADLAQWGAVGALICGIIGLFVLISVERANYVPTETEVSDSAPVSLQYWA